VAVERHRCQPVVQAPGPVVPKAVGTTAGAAKKYQGGEGHVPAVRGWRAAPVKVEYSQHGPSRAAGGNDQRRMTNGADGQHRKPQSRPQHIRFE
jgi:hypothetical protein